jgi:hypothetical protein
MSPGATASRGAHEQGLARLLRCNRRARFSRCWPMPGCGRTLKRELAHFERRGWAPVRAAAQPAQARGHLDVVRIEQG